MRFIKYIDLMNKYKIINVFIYFTLDKKFTMLYNNNVGEIIHKRSRRR